MGGCLPLGPGVRAEETWGRKLPSCQGGNGHKGPQLYVPTTQRTGDQFMFINVPSHTEESLCRPVLQGPFPPEPAAQTPEGG